MKLILAAPSLTPRQRRSVERSFRHTFPRLQREMGRFAPKDPKLRVRVATEGTTERPIYYMTVSIQLPSHPLVVQKNGDDLHTVVMDADRALQRELQHVTARLRREALLRKRRTNRDEFARFVESAAEKTDLPEVRPQGEPEAGAANIFIRLRPLLKPLEDFAREHIRSAEASGELPQGYLDADDVVDSAILGIAEQNGRAWTPESLEHELYRRVDSAISEEIARYTAEGSGYSLQEAAPADERWGIEGPEVDEGEYHMPYAQISMSDILADEHAHTPLVMLSEAEQHRLILKSLQAMPSKARSAFYLHRVEGFDLFEIAMIQNRSEREVARDIEKCSGALQAGLQGVERSRRPVSSGRLSASA